MLTKLVITAAVGACVASMATGQIGKRVTPIVDIGAIVRTIPLFATVPHVDFACRAADGNWWLLAGGYLLRLDSSFNPLGAIAAPAGIPVYEPTTDRIYFAFGITGQIWVCLVNCWPPWLYTQTSFGLDYLQLDGSTTFVRQLAGYPFAPFTPGTGGAQPPPYMPPSQSPGRCAVDGVGGVLVDTAAGVFRLDALSGATSATGWPSAAGQFMLLPGSMRGFVGVPGSCNSGPGSACITEFDMASGIQLDHRFPVDLSVPGPGTQRGGALTRILPLFDQGKWLAFLLVNDATTTFGYACDVTTQSDWSGCGGGFTSGPVIEQSSLTVSAQVPASVAWLIASSAFFQATIPGLLPPSCITYLDPFNHIALPAVLVPASGTVSWNIAMPVVPGLDNATLFFQVLHANLSGFGATSARSTVVRQY